MSLQRRSTSLAPQLAQVRITVPGSPSAEGWTGSVADDDERTAPILLGSAVSEGVAVGGHLLPGRTPSVA